MTASLQSQLIDALSWCRLEDANIRNPRGIAKVVGTLVSLAGVMSMTLYKGPVMKNLGHPLINIHRGNGVVHENWLKGSILTAASCITWSIRYIMQVFRQNSSDTTLAIMNHEIVFSTKQTFKHKTCKNYAVPLVIYI